MEKLSDEQKKVIKKIAVDNGFEGFEISVSSGSNKGDNFMGVIMNVVIKKDDRRLDLVLKSAYADTGKNFLADVIYKKEIYVYEKLFHLYDAIQKEFNVKHPFTGHANMYGSFISERAGFLVMDDLRTKGFNLWNKSVPMNNEHIRKVVQEYAKIHSLGMIVKHKKPEMYEEIKKHVFIGIPNEEPEQGGFSMQNYARDVTGVLSRILKDDKSAREIVLAFLQNLDQYFNEMYDTSQYDYTIIHGDCWCNNMMFKYEDSQKKSDPSEVRILDWQLSRASDPAADLSYYFFTTMDIEHLRNYKDYLKVYYDVLSENLKSAGLAPEQVYTFAMLEEHFKKYCFLGFLAALSIGVVSLATEGELPDINGFADLPKILSANFSRKSEYEARIRDSVHFMIDIDAI